MKRVLVVGQNSYIGKCFAQYARSRLDICIIDSYEGWKDVSFKDYSSVLFVAGIAHRRQNKRNKDLYFAVNRDLAVEVAQKAKASGVRHFIYLSSMAVYGMSPVKGEITANIEPTPRKNDYYSESKFQAELLLKDMAFEDFRIAIIRPPMVYGPGCPGKFSSLAKVAKFLPVIPWVNNQRSMIYIDNLSELLCIVIKKGIYGVICPHNKEYTNTSWLLQTVATVQGNNATIWPSIGLLVRLFMPICPPLKNAFSSLYYGSDVARMPFSDNYQIVALDESVKISVL